MTKQIMLVDDELDILKSLKRTLKIKNYDVITVSDPSEALILAEQTPPSVVITDFRMPKINGQQLIEALKKIEPNIQCMVLSGQADYEDMKALLNANNTFRFISKPWSSDELYQAVEDALESHKKNVIKQQVLQTNPAPIVEVDEFGNIIDCNLAYTELVAAEKQRGNLHQLFVFEQAVELNNFGDKRVATLASTGTLCQLELKLIANNSYLFIIKTLTPVSNEFEGFYRTKQQFLDTIEYQPKSVVICLKIRDLLVKNLIANMPSWNDGFASMVDHDKLRQHGEYTLLEIGYDQGVFFLNSVANELAVHKFLDTLTHLISVFFNRKGVQVKFSASYTTVKCEQELSALIDNLVIYNQFVSESKTDFYMQYSHSLLSEKLNEHKVSEALYSAIENDEFFLLFQPKLDLKKQSISSCEALIRWSNDTIDMTSPAYFIPIAEKDGHIIKIGNWVLDIACKTIAKWLQQDIPVTKVAVNISAQQLSQSDFTYSIKSILEKNNIAAKHIELEITESAVLEDIHQAREKLLELKLLGLSIAVDDFGTGYSSLSNIARLPVDIIKIDRSLIEDIAGDKSARDLVQNVIRLVHGLGLKVVAEGVENVEQLEVLDELGCDEVQGYLIGRPVTDDELGHFVYES